MIVRNTFGKLCVEGSLIQMLESAKAMQQEGIPLTRNEAYCLLQKCRDLKELESSRQVRSLIVLSDLDCLEVLGNHLIRLFASCGNLVEAMQAFETIRRPSVYSWSAIMSANANAGQQDAVLGLYHKIHLAEVRSDKYVYLAVLKACILISSFLYGRLVHVHVMENGFSSDVILGNTLLDMYAKCGELKEAFKVFQKLPSRNVVSWNTMVAAYVYNGESVIALQTFKNMQEDGIKPDKITFLSLLKASSSIQSVEHGRHVHYLIIEDGLESNAVIGNTLVDMYAKCSCLREAHCMFQKLLSPDVVSWSALILGYANHDDSELALDMFERMQLEGIMPDEVTVLGVVKASANTGNIQTGRLVHAYQLMESGADLNATVGSALVDMYAKCESPGEACRIFDRLHDRDVISWTAMIGAYAQNEQGSLALQCFEEMQHRDVKPTDVTFFSALKAIGSIGAIEKGRILHHQIMKEGFGKSVVVGSILIDMYTKCGSLEEAYKAFIRLPSQNVVSWGAMVAGYAQHGHGVFAINCFQELQKKGINPDEGLFTNILIACSRVGMVDEGHWYFNSMTEHHAIAPTVSHCTCMIDMLSRAGRLNEAKNLLQGVNQFNIMGWTTLLSACKTHRNMKLGDHCVYHVNYLDSHSAAGYVLMSNMYAGALQFEN